MRLRLEISGAEKLAQGRLTQARDVEFQSLVLGQGNVRDLKDRHNASSLDRAEFQTHRVGDNPLVPLSRRFRPSENDGRSSGEGTLDPKDQIRDVGCGNLPELGAIARQRDS